jgi:hypothetical protein
MIDACTSTFLELTEVVLPGYMAQLRNAMTAPYRLAEFCTAGVGIKGSLRLVNRTNDFSGCYVLMRERKPFYVGISRAVVARLRQHGKGTTHFDASLAYRMACEKAPHEVTRDEAMKNSGFRQAFDEAQALLRDSSVAFVKIENPLELYLFEAYCAMEFDTCEWNTFRTH